MKTDDYRANVRRALAATRWLSHPDRHQLNLSLRPESIMRTNIHTKNYLLNSPFSADDKLDSAASLRQQGSHEQIAVAQGMIDAKAREADHRRAYL